MGYMYINSQNMVNTATEVMFYSLTPDLLTWAIYEAKSLYTVDGGLKVLSIAQPAYRYHKIHSRPAWSQQAPVTEENMHRRLVDILNEEGGNAQQSLKWLFLKELFNMLLSKGNRDVLGKINQFGSEETKNLLKDAQVSDVFCDVSHAISTLDKNTEFLKDNSIDTYIAKISDGLKELIFADSPELKQEIPAEAKQPKSSSCSVM